MVMKVFSILMGRNNDFKALSPEYFGQFDTNFMCLLRGDLSGCKTLVTMKSENAALFMILSFGQHHFLNSGIRQAVQARDVKGLLCFFILSYVIRDLLQDF